MAQLKDSLITGDLRVTGTIYGNATSATKLQNARTIAISGGATGTATSFDGSENITIPVTGLDMSKANAGTLPVERGGTGATTFTANRVLLGNGTSAIKVGNVNYTETAGTKGGTKYMFRVWGTTVGNAATELVSQTAGVMRFGDAGPQIQFSSAETGGQQGALIFTDHDSSGAGVSWHFVSDQSDNNNGGNATVTAPRFRARAGLTIGQNSDNTNYNLYVNGTSLLNGELINQTGGIWIQGGSAAGSNSQRMTLTAGMPVNLAYNTSKRGTRIYSNGIAFADPYNGNSNNDAGWVRHIEETANTGTLEIATGDDANEQIVIRQYNTSSAVTSELKLLDGSHNTTIPGRLTMSGGQAINQILTGTGTAASDKGSGVSPRYFPARWTFNTGRAAVDGDIYTIKIPVAGHTYGVFMSVNNGTNYYPVVLNGTGRITTHYAVNTYLTVIFESTGSAADMYALNGADARATVSGGVFRVINFYDSNSNTIPASWCGTAAATAAKAADHSNFALRANSYTLVTMRYANSAASAITLNINGTGAKPIYINGSASSASNYTLPAGTYLVYYNGTNYYFRTDNYITTGNIAGHASSDLALSGGTMTGPILMGKTGGSWVSGMTQSNSMLQWTTVGVRDGSRYDPIMWGKDDAGNVWNLGVHANGGIGFFGFKAGRTANGTDGQICFDPATGNTTATRLYGAVWNDFAEFRQGENNPGRVMIENGDDSISISTKRLQPGASICSDTYGFAIGETEECKCPIAVAGRVLAYPLEPREQYGFFIGQAVCSGPSGTVSIMTKDEVKEYPECVIGYISAVPKYETWGTGNVKVDGRIWIKVK